MPLLTSLSDTEFKPQTSPHESVGPTGASVVNTVQEEPPVLGRAERQTGSAGGKMCLTSPSPQVTATDSAVATVT